MLTLTLVTAALAFPALVAAQTPPFVSPFLFSTPAQLDGKKCIQPSGGSLTAGATLTIAQCTNSAAQKITWSGTRVKMGSNLCWTAKSGNSTVSLATCNSNDSNQSWYFNKFGGNQVKHNPTGRCLDLTGANTATGTPVRVQSCNKGIVQQVWNPSFIYGTAPAKSQTGQFGTNQCGTGFSNSSNCQTVVLNNLNDFCLWAPPTRGTVGDKEGVVVSYCLKKGRGTRLIPDGTLKGVHFVKTKDYIQITGFGDFTSMNIPAGDAGGELDPHGPTGNGNPVGGLVYSNAFGSNVQHHEWASFMSATEFCFRACLGENAQRNCPHIYDVMGCFWNQPGNYAKGVFESCDGEDTLPAGIYGSSTWHQGQSPTPPGHSPAPSSNCVKQATVRTGDLSGTTTSPPTTTTNGPTPTGKPIRSGSNNNKCIAAASNANGAALIITDCNGSASQLWTQVGNTFRVNGLCIDVTNGVDAKGTKLQVWSCGSGNANQQFTYNANGDKHFTWISHDKSIDVTNGNFTNGNQLQIWQRSTTTNNQLWTF